MFSKAVLIGRLARDPELRQTQNGVEVCAFTVACQRPYTDGSGTRRADFIPVVAWRSAAGFVAQYFRKGDPIGVDGRIETRSYTDRDGNERRTFEVVVERAFFVAAKGEGGGGERPPEPPPPDDGDLPF